MQRRTLLRATASLGAIAALPAVAQQGAGTTVIWSGFPSGGLGDQVTRPLLDQMRGKLPQNLVLDSKPGAGGRIAAEFVRRAAPDGSNLVQAPSSVIALHPHVFKTLPYDTLADFAPVAGICSFTCVFTAGPGVPADVRTVADYLRWAKAHPADANIGIPNAGSSMHIAGMLLAKQSGLDLRTVPFKGGGPLLTNLLGGQIPVSIAVVSEVLPQIRAGKLRALAVTAPERWKALPDVPTMKEQGFADIGFVDWLGWFGPAQMPAAQVNAVNTAVLEGLGSPKMDEIFASSGLEPMRLTAPQFKATVQQHHAYWGRVVKATGFKPED